MSAFDARRREDVAKLRAVAAASGGRVTVTRVRGDPPAEIELALRYKTASSQAYPSVTQDLTTVAITLPARYPFVEPGVKVTSPIYHPNVYSSGKVCLGTKWIGTEGLELLLRRLIQILIFDHTILNEGSPANSSALAWYRKARAAHPRAFPTDRLQPLEARAKPASTWRDVGSPSPPPAWRNTSRSTASAPQLAVTTCPHCKAKLRLPAGRVGRVRCPKCELFFEART